MHRGGRGDSRLTICVDLGESWTNYKNNMLEGIVQDKRDWKKEVLGKDFINGPPSNVVVRSVDRDEGQRQRQRQGQRQRQRRRRRDRQRDGKTESETGLMLRSGLSSSLPLSLSPSLPLPFFLD